MSMPHGIGLIPASNRQGRIGVSIGRVWRHAEAWRPQPMSWPMSPCSWWAKIVAQQWTRIACVFPADEQSVRMRARC